MLQIVAYAHTVPDLAFSEMRFLQNSHGETNPTAQASDAKQKRKKDHTRAKEDGISAFFTSVRPAFVKTDGNVVAKGERPAIAKPSRRGRVRKPSTVLDTTIPTVEVKGYSSYLGSEGRGPRHESNSYFSWSESIRASRAGSARHQEVSSIRKEQLDLLDRDCKEISHYEEVSVKRRAPSLTDRESIGAFVEHTKIPSVSITQSGLSRSHSLRRRSSPPPGPNPIHRATDQPTIEYIIPASSMVPVRRTCDNAESKKFPVADCSRGRRSTIKFCPSENAVSAHGWLPRDADSMSVRREGSQQSLSLGGVLRHCLSVSQTDCWQAASCENRYVETFLSPGVHDTVRQSRRSSDQRTVPAPTVRSSVANTQAPELARFFSPSFYLPQAYDQHLAVRFGPKEDDEHQHLDVAGRADIDETDLLEQVELESLSEQPVLCENFDDDCTEPVYVEDNLEPTKEPEHMKAVASGFWRPNKLY